jgi:hypothetical protein
VDHYDIDYIPFVNKFRDVGFDVLTAVVMKRTIFWHKDVASVVMVEG